MTGDLFARGSLARMTELQFSFPSLRDAPNPFHASSLDQWARAKSHGEKLAASFVLSVWTGFSFQKGRDTHQWPWKHARPFDLHEALGVWDAGNRAAFIAWARDPWWP